MAASLSRGCSRPLCNFADVSTASAETPSISSHCTSSLSWSSRNQRVSANQGGFVKQQNRVQVRNSTVVYSAFLRSPFQGSRCQGRSLTPQKHWEVARGHTRRRCQPAMALFGLGSEAPPESIPLTPLKTEEDLEAALKTAEEEGHALLIDWMATWCRKCIYLLPKMEKLSAEFQDVKFYMVNVNEVPGALVKRGGIQKMPTIQLWKNNERVGEVIGGHKAWMVMDEIRDMIKTGGDQGSSS